MLKGGVVRMLTTPLTTTPLTTFMPLPQRSKGTLVLPRVSLVWCWALQLILLLPSSMPSSSWSSSLAVNAWSPTSVLPALTTGRIGFVTVFPNIGSGKSLGRWVSQPSHLTSPSSRRRSQLSSSTSLRGTEDSNDGGAPITTTTTRGEEDRVGPPSSYSSPPSSSSSPLSSSSSSSSSVHPQIGDIVRYYDLDGGIETGQVLVGKISYIFRINNKEKYSVELTPLDDVGDGYYAEYSSSSSGRRRTRKKVERDLDQISPILASYVQREQAYKVPMMMMDVSGGNSKGSNRLVPKVRQEMYDLDDYNGPTPANVDQFVLETDQQRYDRIKITLLKNTALVGLGGTVIVNIIQGTEDGIIYGAGVIASLLYLFLLSVKTDSMAPTSAAASGNNGEQQNRLGKPIANLRFFMPVLLLMGIALYNQSNGGLVNSSDGGSNGNNNNINLFHTVTAEQFANAILGFLTYRVPLFIGQIRDAFADDDNVDLVDGGSSNNNNALVLPGSAGIALRAIQQGSSGSSNTIESVKVGSNTNEMVTILLVSGPQATGRSELVERLLAADNNDNNNNGRLVSPRWVQRIDDGATFERLQRRNEFLDMDALATKGLTKRSIMEASSSRSDVVVVDANIDLAKKLQRLPGVRLIGVWVGLETIEDFERRLEEDIANGKIDVPPEETKESVIRARMKEIIGEIEYGLSSGIFEFTILNYDPDKSLKELKDAAAYAFK